MDMDKILLLDKGHVAEFASPQELLKDANSRFSTMVDSGKNGTQLREIAANAVSGLKKPWWEDATATLGDERNLTVERAKEAPVVEAIPNPTQP